MTGYYARSMPYLGFDPAPGDVGSVQYLGRQHHMAAEEIRQAARQVTAVDLSSWQGSAAMAAGLVRDTLAGTLGGIASNMEALAEACTIWAGQLSQYQDEAGTFERQARTATADHDHLVQQQASLKLGGSSANVGELDVAQTRLQEIRQRAQQLHQEYLAAAGRLARQLDGPSAWERTEPERKILELVLAPFDLAAGDHWIEVLERITGVLDERARDLGVGIKAAQAEDDLGLRGQMIVDLARDAEAYLQSDAAWDTWAPRWARILSGNYGSLTGFGKTMDGLGILADIGTEVSPQDSGDMAIADRTVAGINGALLAADMASVELGPVGGVVIFATGAYLASDFLYHHWKPFHDVADDAGHAVVKAVDFINGQDYQADLAISRAAGQAGEDVAIAALHPDRVVKTVARRLWHSAASTVESWF
jgi:hypothetical protein